MYESSNLLNIKLNKLGFSCRAMTKTKVGFDSRFMRLTLIFLGRAIHMQGKEC
jgi:hypothetical protein